MATSSLRKIFIAAILLTALLAAASAFATEFAFQRHVTVRQFITRETYSANSFRIGFQDGSIAVFTMKPDLPLAQFLREQQGHVVTLTLEVQR